MYGTNKIVRNEKTGINHMINKQQLEADCGIAYAISVVKWKMEDEHTWPFVK